MGNSTYRSGEIQSSRNLLSIEPYKEGRREEGGAVGVTGRGRGHPPNSLTYASSHNPPLVFPSSLPLQILFSHTNKQLVDFSLTTAAPSRPINYLYLLLIFFYRGLLICSGWELVACPRC